MVGRAAGEWVVGTLKRVRDAAPSPKGDLEVPESQPNLFAYATSELSQDAFLCWLLAWADRKPAEEDPALHELAVGFVAALFEAARAEPPEPPFSVEVLRQVEGADVVALVGKGHVLVIEDKVDTTAHSDQLARYRDALGDEYGDRELVCVYLKTGDQSSYATVERQGWATVTRRDLLEVLRRGRDSVENAVFQYFLEHLEEMDARVRRCHETPVDEWEPRDDAYKGLYQALQERLEEGRWKYIPNPRGGFLGFYWGWTDITGGKIYLQLEEDKLVVKVKVEDPDRERDMRDSWSKRVIEAVDDVDLARPARFGRGKHMTVAEYGDYRISGDDGLLDLDKTVSLLEEAHQAVQSLAGAER